jgi:hypothetical protein
MFFGGRSSDLFSVAAGMHSALRCRVQPLIEEGAEGGTGSGRVRTVGPVLTMPGSGGGGTRTGVFVYSCKGG